MIETEESYGMKEKDFIIRTMSRDDLDTAVEWAAAEGWNPGLYDADRFYAADPDGFLIGVLNDEPIATISVVKYGSTFGFLGFYIVKSQHRGKGYGIQIWNAGMKYLEGRNVGLDGVKDQQGNYRKSGFKLAYSNIRYEGKGGGNPPVCSGIVELNSLPFETIEAYDRPFFPESRTAFLKSWIKLPESRALGIMRDGGLVGYGVIRKCRLGYKIGPLFADNAEFAESLFLKLKSKVPPSESIFLDTPEVNSEAVALAEKYGMKVVFGTARMYTGEAPDLPLAKLFGVTTFELG
jgi:hypothetical protein